MEKCGARPDRRPASELRLILKNGSLWKGAGGNCGIPVLFVVPSESHSPAAPDVIPPCIFADVRRNRKVVAAHRALFQFGARQTRTLSTVPPHYSRLISPPILFARGWIVRVDLEGGTPRGPHTPQGEKRCEERRVRYAWLSRFWLRVYRWAKWHEPNRKKDAPAMCGWWMTID